jgi:predicted RNA-binding protein with PUA-like domain
MNYWLFKSDPDTFSFADLLAAPRRRTGWDGVRNFQARNFLRDAVRVGDGVLFYHASAEPTGVAGTAKVVRAGYPEKDPTWTMVDIEAVEGFPQVVTRQQLAADPSLRDMMVLKRGARLSIQPVTASQWRAVLALGRSPERR